MEDIYVVYFSSTGNTEAMAKAVAEGIGEAGGKAELSETEGFDVSRLKEAGRFALGCPACGAEELDDSVESLMEGLGDSLTGKKVGLFGSYGWGDGDWMRAWEERVREAGGEVVGGEGIIVNGEPNDETLQSLRELGRAMMQ